jgi:hypothetical protein
MRERFSERVAEVSAYSLHAVPPGMLLTRRSSLERACRLLPLFITLGGPGRRARLGGNFRPAGGRAAAPNP